MTLLDEGTLLTLFALRFDGYGWCREQDRDSAALMNAYWKPDTFDDLLSQSPAYRMTVMFLQQRSLRNMGSGPEGEILRLWRRLFISLVDEEVPERFDGSFLYGGGLRVARERVPQLKEAIESRLERNAPAGEPLELQDEAR